MQKGPPLPLTPHLPQPRYPYQISVTCEYYLIWKKEFCKLQLNWGSWNEIILDYGWNLNQTDDILTRDAQKKIDTQRRQLCDHGERYWKDVFLRPQGKQCGQLPDARRACKEWILSYSLQRECSPADILSPDLSPGPRE